MSFLAKEKLAVFTSNAFCPAIPHIERADFMAWRNPSWLTVRLISQDAGRVRPFTATKRFSIRDSVRTKRAKARGDKRLVRKCRELEKVIIERRTADDCACQD